MDLLFNFLEETIILLIIQFISAPTPYGGIPIGTDSTGPDNVDWSGITTHSTFQGRTFMRSGISNESNSTYNQLYFR